MSFYSKAKADAQMVKNSLIKVTNGVVSERVVLAHEQGGVRFELLTGSDGERPGLPYQLPECEVRR